MWPFSRKRTKEEFFGYKRIRVNGMRFTIKRINPLLDFPADKIPQIFVDFISRRAPKPDTASTVPELKRQFDDMVNVIKAGVVDPPLVGDGILPEDLFRDPGMGQKLYIDILAHSLNAFSGLKGVFFYHKIRLSLWTEWLKGMGQLRQELRSQMAASR